MLSKSIDFYRYFLELSYNGKGFHGWQIQPNAHTVQEEINKALSTLLQTPINVVGSGRTDTGVHASHFVAHFDIEKPISSTDDLLFKLNRFISNDVSIHTMAEVDGEAHSRFSATARTYHYLLTRSRNPFWLDLAWYHPKDLDIIKMNQAAKLLLRNTDFTSFAKLHTDTKTNNCVLEEAKWSQSEDFMVFTVTADRFLRNMVRAMVGTLIEVGLQKIDGNGLEEILQAKNRSAAGQSAPAHGLFLTHVAYPKDVFKTKAKSPFPSLF